MRAAADAQEEVMEPFFESHGWEYAPQLFESVPALKERHQPTAFGGLDIAGTFVLFIGTCFGKKVFDEIYDRTVKRPIAQYLDKFFSVFSIYDGKMLEYRDVIYFKDIDLVVVIRTLIDKNNTKAVEEDLLNGHIIAHAYVERNGKKAAIHCHVVTNGLVSSEPLLFDSLEKIKEHDKNIVKRIKRY
ncbi:hypothetical protein GCM10027395_13260 [Giesbergeria sinuosa]